MSNLINFFYRKARFIYYKAMHKRVCKKFGFYFVIMYCRFCLMKTGTSDFGNFKVLFLAVSNRFKPNINI